MRKLIILLLLLLVSKAGAFNGMKPIIGRQINRGHTLSKGLVGCWLMNEGCGDKVYDLSGNGYDLTNGAGLSWVAGKFGSAIDYAGVSAFSSIATINHNIGNGPFAWIVWVKPTDLSGTWDGVMSVGNYAPSMYVSGSVAGTPSFYWAGTETNGSAITVNEWVCLACTREGTTVRIYQDGAYKNAGTYGVGVSMANTQFQIGAGKLTGEYLEGIVSNAIFFNRTLSAPEIALLYHDPYCMLKPSFDMFLYGALGVPTVGGQVIFVNFN